MIQEENDGKIKELSSTSSNLPLIYTVKSFKIFWSSSNTGGGSVAEVDIDAFDVNSLWKFEISSALCLK